MFQEELLNPCKLATRILHIIDGTNFLEYVKASYEINRHENKYSTYKELNLNELRSNFDLIVIHFLRKEYLELLQGTYFDVKRIVWTIWGADAYQLGRFYNIHLMPLTKKQRYSLEFSKGLYKGVLNVLKSIAPTYFDYQNMFRKQIKCIGLIKNVITLAPNDDFELINYYGLQANSFHINYLDPIFLNTPKNEPIVGDNILLGNSAEYTNNHYDALDILSGINLGSKRVIIPVSYGDRNNGQFVAEYAVKKLGKNAKPLLDFMPINEYTSILNSCEISIMPHIRQQALGNTVKLILNGSNVYFNKESNVYKFFMSNGFFVSKLEDLSLLRTLTLEEKKHNYSLIEKFFGCQATHTKILEMVSKILK